jgi:hypothetical protein
VSGPAELARIMEYHQGLEILYVVPLSGPENRKMVEGSAA